MGILQQIQPIRMKESFTLISKSDKKLSHHPLKENKTQRFVTVKLASS